MKAGLIHATLLIIGIGAMGCGAVPEPPLACTDEDFTFEYCQALGMVCNEAVTLADECPAFVNELEVYIGEVIIPMAADSLSFLPPFISVQDLVAMIFEEYVGVCGELDILGEMGTCQFVDEGEDPCTEDADCREQLVCEQGICVVPAEPEPECLEDADCPEEHVCQQGMCMVAEAPECLEDADCRGGRICLDQRCERVR